MAEGGAAPYTANLVPQIGLLEPGDVAGVVQHLQDLERFLSEELERVETAMRLAPVHAAYASLLVTDGPIADQPLVKDVPTPIEGFNNFAPIQPNRVTAIVGAGADSLQVLESGVYWLQCQITATVDAGTTYAISIAVNGVLIPIAGVVDASNQTTFITLTFYGLRTMDAGDICTVVATATAAQAGPFTFIIESATFSAVRVSELHTEAELIP